MPLGCYNFFASQLPQDLADGALTNALVRKTDRVHEGLVWFWFPTWPFAPNSRLWSCLHTIPALSPADRGKRNSRNNCFHCVISPAKQTISSYLQLGGSWALCAYVTRDFRTISRVNREPNIFTELLNTGRQTCILTPSVLGLTRWPSSRGCHSQAWGQQLCAQKVLTLLGRAGGSSAWCFIAALSGWFAQLLWGFILYYKPSILSYIS